MNKLSDEEFKQAHWAEEDRHLFTNAKWNGGYRWFRSPNIVPIEQARAARKTKPSEPNEAA
jgi:hypothetical protein